MLKENPKAKYFFDLFGGGGAMSFEAIQRLQIEKVFYNEINRGVVTLLEDIRDNGVTDKYYNWIDRDTFNENKDKDTWLGGLCKVVWSFGNNQNGYLFGKDIAGDKKILHDIVVNKCEKSLKIFNEKYELDIEMNQGLFGENRKQRRKRMQNTIVTINNKDRGLENLQRLENLERLQNLENLERLQNLENLEITCQSYSTVNINTPIDETIIYLDPPYKKTAKYQSGICYDTLYRYIEESPYKIYLSSYESPLDCVLELEHRSILSATANNPVIEKLFTNNHPPTPKT